MIGDKFGDGGDEDKDEHGNDAVECDDCDGFDNCGNEDVHGDTYDLIEVAVVLITVMIVLLAVLLLVSALVMDNGDDDGDDDGDDEITMGDSNSDGS